MARALLHRHQLAWLNEAGWEDALRRARDGVASEFLAHWAKRRLPLVVTRQPEDCASEAIALALAAPGRWQHRRLAIHVQRDHVLHLGEFPRAEHVEHLVAQEARPAWRRLCAALRAGGAVPRVHGSYGWQHMSGLDHVRPGSDIDLWISIADTRQADAVAARLQAFACARPRLDGELVFETGHAVAWREWLAWRAGRVQALLVKHLNGIALWQDPLLLDACAVAQVAI